MDELSLSVLIVEDDPEHSALCRAALQAAGFRTAEAASLAQARSRLAESAYPLLLLDIALPDGSGLEALAIARERDPRALAVVQTGFSSQESALEALRLGAYDYLVKPTHAGLLQASLNRAAERYRLERDLHRRVGDAAREIFALNERLSRNLAQLQETNARQTRFLEDLAHELRNPLCVVTGYTTYLQETLEGPFNLEETRRALGAVDRNARHLQGLLERLLETARMDGGKTVLAREPLAAAAALADAWEDFHPAAAAKGARLSAEAAPGLTAFADRTRLRQILSNLVGNALKHVQPGGRVDLRAEARGEHVLFSVCDDGPGMTAEQAARVFERFYQVRGTHEAKEGLGLGLTIVRGLVALHGGRVWVESSPGRGARFYFTLPANGAASKALAER